MRFGAIPNINTLHLVRHRPYHLALAGVIKDDPKAVWRKFYQSEAELGSFITLDNGAYEGKSLEAKELYHIARDIGAQEIVLPDVLTNGAETFHLTHDALRFFSKMIPLMVASNIRLAIVPQAPTIYLWGRNLNELMTDFKKFMGDFPYTITLPKHTAKWDGGRSHLYERFVEKYVDQDNCHVNFLGIGENPRDLASMALRYPIRSIDSAKPFIYALNNIWLQTGYAPIPECPPRPENFFGLPFDAYQQNAATINIDVFTELLSPSIMRDHEVL